MKNLISIIIMFLILQNTYQNEECSGKCMDDNCDNESIQYGHYCGFSRNACEGLQPCDQYDNCCLQLQICVKNDQENTENCHKIYKKCLQNVLSTKAKTFSLICKPKTVVQSLIKILPNQIELSKFKCSKECVALNCDSMNISYGNYCGFNHSGCEGVKPCDAYDTCCQAHDKCVANSPQKLLDFKCHDTFSKCLKQAIKNNEPTWTDQCQANQIVQNMSGAMEQFKSVINTFGGTEIDIKKGLEKTVSQLKKLTEIQNSGQELTDEQKDFAKDTLKQYEHFQRQEL